MKKLQMVILGLAILILILGAIEINNSPLGVRPCSEYQCDASLYPNPCTIICSAGG